MLRPSGFLEMDSAFPDSYRFRNILHCLRRHREWIQFSLVKLCLRTGGIFSPDSTAIFDKLAISLVSEFLPA